MTRHGFSIKVGALFIALSVAISLTLTPLVAAQSIQSATFSMFNYPFLGNTHIAVDLNGDGVVDGADIEGDAGFGAFHGRVTLLGERGSGEAASLAGPTVECLTAHQLTRALPEPRTRPRCFSGLAAPGLRTCTLAVTLTAP